MTKADILWKKYRCCKNKVLFFHAKMQILYDSRKKTESINVEIYELIQTLSKKYKKKMHNVDTIEKSIICKKKSIFKKPKNMVNSKKSTELQCFSKMPQNYWVYKRYLIKISSTRVATAQTNIYFIWPNVNI